MKKTIVFLMILALVVPATAMAATEFSLGGFIKLDSFWDSSQGGKNMNTLVGRSNNAIFGGEVFSSHGRMKFTAQGSRFNLTIKGPDLFGAKTTGFIEMDFDSATDPLLNASNNYIPRLRHAMFRFNWPTTELLFGQYWSMFCEWYSEPVEDGPLQMTGTPTARLAQVRVTQTWGNGDWTAGVLIGEPTNINTGVALNTYPGSTTNNGEAAETPQVQAKLRYEHDWWGKAPYYGKPQPFTAQITGGWQRNTLRSTGFAFNGIAFPFSWGQNQFTAPTGFVQNTNLNPYMFMGTLFIPVIPVVKQDVAGSAHLLTQWWIGQGVEAFGFVGPTTPLFKFNNNFWSLRMFDAELLKRYGGMVEAQYYFTNRWFANVVWGMSKSYGVSRSLIPQVGANGQPIGVAGNNEIALGADQPNLIWQIDSTLWYRPVQALKFGLQYSFVRTTYFQTIGTNVNAQGFPLGNTTTSNAGNEHRVEFAGYFYF